MPTRVTGSDILSTYAHAASVTSGGGGTPIVSLYVSGKSGSAQAKVPHSQPWRDPVDATGDACLEVIAKGVIIERVLLPHSALPQWPMMCTSTWVHQALSFVLRDTLTFFYVT